MNIYKLVNRQFNKVLLCSQIAENFKNDNIFHNSFRMKYIMKGKSTYYGKNNCGITTFILGNILKKYIPIELHLYKYGYGKYIEDHVFIKSDDLIIDPTYRQFFNDNRNYGMSNYNNYLYNHLPPFFVGTQNDLYKLFLVLKNKNKEEFNHNIITDDILDNWNTNSIITKNLDKYHLINNENKVKKLIDL